MQVESGRYFEQAIGEFTSRLLEFEKTIEPMAHPDNEDDLNQLEGIMQFGLAACREMHQATEGDLERRRSFRKKFLDATAPWCNQSWIIHRARTKPRGFPGDYQMLLAIYDGVPLARGLGGYLDRWCLKMTLGKAVYSRLQSVKSFLIGELSRRQGHVDVLDIASGPGREFQWVRTKGIECKVNMSCLDSDDGALFADRL
jgi:extracellular factor (EF) 3-hydroxypalmitic acid methyl ester biosynthesis protein